MVRARSYVVLMLMCCVALAGTAYAAAPVANFVGSNCAGSPALTVSFTDISTNTPTSWSWTFGDGGSSTSANPTHTYTAAGNYTVTLTASNASGSDTIGKADFAIVTSNRVVNVNTSESLRLACWNALDGDVIMVADGTYLANNKPWCRLENKTGVILRSASGDDSRVTLQGYGWDSKPEGNNDLLWVYGSSDITVCFLHFEEARSFGIKVTNLLLNGRGVENLNIHDCSFLNIGVRMIKGTGGNLTPVQTGSIRQCHFENTKIPPSNWQDGGNYITAIDMMVLRNWTIADNVFKNIKGNSGGGRGAIFIWVESQNVTAERNVITGCDRSIAYGNPSTSSDNPTQPHMTNGVIRNNFIVNNVDTGIELCWVNGVKVYQNTVLTANDSGKGVHYHWNTLQNIHIANNIVRGQIYGDAGAGVTLEGNLQTGIQDSWFVNVPTGDLHLTSLATPAIDEVNRLADAPTDFDQQDRPTTPGMTDIGADEYVGAPPGPPVADFSGNPTSGNAPLTVAFTDLSTGSPTSWSWTFGDGGSSGAQHPSHTYNNVDTYTVSLTATNAYGSDTETKTNYITATEPAVPTFVAAGTVAYGTGAITPALPAGIAANDILLLFLETANQAISISNQNGGTWTAVANSPQGTGTAGGTSATRLTVFWSRYNGTQGAPTASDSGNHQLGCIIGIRGVATSGDPWNVTAGGVESTADTSGAIPGATTTVAKCLVVAAIATSLPDANGTANFSAWANSNLTNVTERTDNTRNSGNGGGLGIATGEKATAGSYGNTTVTCGTSAVKGMMSIALKP